jgi:hypothetical protein
VDHSARVMQVITWNRSFKGIPQPENVKNELDDDEWETHATVLDKLLAWEKKLYHEVKVNYVFKITRLSQHLLEACIFSSHPLQKRMNDFVFLVIPTKNYPLVIDIENNYRMPFIPANISTIA